MLPFLHELESYLGKLKKKGGVRINPKPVAVLGLALLVVSFVFMPGVVSTALSLSLFLAPLWLPMLLISGAWSLWVILRRSEYIANQKHIVLEIRPPRSIEKTPLAMEAVLSGLHLSPGEGTWYKKFINGAVRPWWSLEIASIEGQVHFFVWTRAGYRRVIEAQIYAQYPGAQVVEVPDYTHRISASPEEWSIWGCDFVHPSDKPDPLPIKTYVEYGLDKVQKEHEQVDPLSNLIEFMGSMGKGEQLWLQFVIRVHKGEKYNKYNEAGKIYTWKDAAKEAIEAIRKEAVYKTKTVMLETGSEIEVPILNPTKGQLETISAIERNVSKLPFDVGIRGVYLAKPGHFDGVNISALVGIFKQFNSEGWNSLGVSGWMTEFDDYPWEVGIDHLKNEYREGLIEAYRRRQFFYPPFDFESYSVMSTEELATVYHIPSRAISAPGLPRIESATSEAPVNLPT